MSTMAQCLRFSTKYSLLILALPNTPAVRCFLKRVVGHSIFQIEVLFPIQPSPSFNSSPRSSAMFHVVLLPDHLQEYMEP